eukprot:TRINITY_DN11810_c0_g1_i1.p1 TRINITY_DN11810_c0_g1~~TRINITY_DN11810_c0_g1_i1.p1  ORF type:complete len:194 (-),score=22.85 TRINITY_DN11810_c0_g1_i1:56-637(-)
MVATSDTAPPVEVPVLPQSDERPLLRQDGEAEREDTKKTTMTVTPVVTVTETMAAEILEKTISRAHLMAQLQFAFEVVFIILFRWFGFDAILGIIGACIAFSSRYQSAFKTHVVLLSVCLGCRVIITTLTVAALIVGSHIGRSRVDYVAILIVVASSLFMFSVRVIALVFSLKTSRALKQAEAALPNVVTTTV